MISLSVCSALLSVSSIFAAISRGKLEEREGSLLVEAEGRRREEK